MARPPAAILYCEYDIEGENHITGQCSKRKGGAAVLNDLGAATHILYCLHSDFYDMSSK